MSMLGMFMGAVAAGAGSMTLDFITSGSIAAASTTTISGVSFGAAAGDREILVVFSTHNSSTPNVTGITIGGVTAAWAAASGAIASGQTGAVEVGYAVVPSGASGNIVITYSVTPAAPTEYAVYRVTGRGSPGTGPSDTTSVALASAATTATLTSIDTPVGGFVLSATVTQSSVTPAISGAGLVINTPASSFRGFASSQVLTSANSNATATWTFSSSVRCVCAAFSFSP